MSGQASDEVSHRQPRLGRPPYGLYHLIFALGLLLLAVSFTSGLRQLTLRGELLRVHAEPWADARMRAERGESDVAIRLYLVGARVDVSGDWAWVQAVLHAVGRVPALSIAAIAAFTRDV